MGLEHNMNMATKVAGQVRMWVPNSSNASFASSPVSAGGRTLNSVKSLAAVRGNTARQRPANPSAWLRDFDDVAARSKAKKMGNCGELAAIACLELRKLGAFPVEYVRICDGGLSRNPAVPHVVAVIGRVAAQRPAEWPADGTRLGLPDAWHADAVICDPWDRVAYPARDYAFFWQGLRKHAVGQLSCTLIHQM